MLKSDISVYSSSPSINSDKVMFTPREDEEPILLTTLYNYFTDERFKIVLNVLDRRNNEISLRLLDWLVTNYAKKFNITYYIPEKNINFNIFISYKQQLKAYSKRQFDPFCRRARIIFTVSDMKLNTTVGQLNFFRWAINNKVIEYAMNNYKEIEEDMLKSIKRHIKTAKRCELSVCAVKSFTCIYNQTSVNLD
tara:strand:- start:863 stop:1444 length:582 start_codon:yes stop_codon:yes gene_type:complete